MADRPEMSGPTRGFSGMADSMDLCKMLWGRPLLPCQRNWARRGDPVAYRLVILLFLDQGTGPQRLQKLLLLLQGVYNSWKS